MRGERKAVKERKGKEGLRAGEKRAIYGMADKDNNNGVVNHNSDNASSSCNNNNNNDNNNNNNSSSKKKKKLKVILKLPHPFPLPSHPSLQQQQQQPHAAASLASGKPDPHGSDPPAAPNDVLHRPEVSRSAAIHALHASKRKFKALGEGLLDELVGSGGPYDADRNGIAGSEAAVLETVKKSAATIHIKKPAHKKIEDIGQNLEAKHAIGGLPSLELDKTPLPPRKVLEVLLDNLQKKDTYQVFAEPVDASLIPDYYDIIKDPMDFGTIRKKLTEGRYVTLELFKKDVFQISINAMRYNGAKTIYYKQARAILDAARKALNSLTGSNFHTETEQKASKVVGSKKPWKKPASVRNRVELVCSDHISGATLATGNSQRYDAGPQKEKGGGSYKAVLFENSATTVDGLCSITHESAREKDLDGSLFDSRGSTALEGTGKPIGWKDGRRPLSIEEYRRSSYQPQNSCSHGQESFFLGVAGEHRQLVAVGHQQDHAYGLSLAQFGASLKPPAWKYVVKKLHKALGPNVPFGRGWVGGQQAGAAPVLRRNNLLEPIKADTAVAPVLQPNNFLEPVHAKSRTQEESKAAAICQKAAQTSQPAILAEDSRTLNNCVLPSLCNNLSAVTRSLVASTNKQLDEPFVQISSGFSVSGPVMDVPTQSTKQSAQGHIDAQRLAMPTILEPSLHPSTKSYSHASSPRKVLSIETVALGKDRNVNATVAGMSILTGMNKSEKEFVMTSRAAASWDCHQHHASKSMPGPSVEQENAFSQSMLLSRKGPVNIPATTSCIVTVPNSNVPNLCQSQALHIDDESEVNINTTAKGSTNPVIQDLNSQIERLPPHFDIRSQFDCNTSQTLSQHQPLPALPPNTQTRESEKSRFQDWKIVKSALYHPPLQINVSSSQISSESFQPFSSQIALQHTSSSARNSPPDLNVCLQSPATPSSRISADSQLPDLALQL
ncbi:hypothetical protein O6H91_06G058700 [Diphasiastrum complanatum]|uniref:Uncharacterized protein n=1 Tax=Diphasiastrum complanatum TaxID=34168 RepID=A0ACC2DEG1_DIPCM|nr:hypothetical protein O6H91_06G058700 [Diphasiastrum complanatum]